MKRFLMMVLVVVMVMALLAGCSKPAAEAPATEAPAAEQPMEPVTIKLAHVVNEQDGFHIAATKFKEIVEEETDGMYLIEIFPNATLGDERTLLEGMQMGTVDMGVITNGPVANFVEEIAVFELPFLFGSPEEAYRILDGEIGQELLDKLETANLKGLAFAERGFRNLTNSKKSVMTPEDMDGLKIRVMENPVYLDTFKALDANAVPMAWTEALTALQQGTIDGQENPVGVIYTFKLYETQNHLSLTRHTYAPAVIVMGNKLYEELPAEVQVIFKDAAMEAARFERQANADAEAEQLQALKDNGMTVVTPDLKAFKEKITGVYDKYGDQFGDYIGRIQSELQ